MAFYTDLWHSHVHSTLFWSPRVGDTLSLSDGQWRLWMKSFLQALSRDFLC